MTTPVHITPPPLSPQSMADLLCTIIILCQGNQADGTPFWAYLCIKPSMAKAFKDARDQGILNIEQFGTIIEWGKGPEPDASVRQHMESHYGFNHKFEDQLLDAAAAIQNRTEA